MLLDWQRELLEERLADASSNPDAWVSWEDAKRRLERLVLFAIDGEYISVYAVVHQARRAERWAPR